MKKLWLSVFAMFVLGAFCHFDGWSFAQNHIAFREWTLRPE
ncbi:MAG: hypothetical protein NTZ57_08360 [Deltaproteobacteria bacterium]|nr:hypothetical protein [Deltaproteobacteria bacterium]